MSSASLFSYLRLSSFWLDSSAGSVRAKPDYCYSPWMGHIRQGSPEDFEACRNDGIDRMAQLGVVEPKPTASQMEAFCPCFSSLEIEATKNLFEQAKQTPKSDFLSGHEI